MSVAPTSRPASSSLMLMSWPLSAFVAGVKIGSGSRSDSRRPGGQLRCRRRCRSADIPSSPSPTGSRARRTRPAAGSVLARQHRPAARARRRAAAPLPGNRSTSSRQQVMRHEIAHALEPERRQLRQDLALVRDARAEHVVERRDAIGRDDEQRRLAVSSVTS